MRTYGIFSLFIIALVIFISSCAGQNEERALNINKTPETEPSPSTARAEIEEIYLEGGKDGIILIHGYSASSLTMRPLAHALHQKGYTVNCILLPGHGRTVEALDDVEKDDYYKYVDEKLTEFREKVDRVFVLGHSLGSLLAIYLAAEHELDGIMLISAPVYDTEKIGDMERIREMAEVMTKIARTVPRPHPRYLFEPDYFKKHGVYREFSTKGVDVLLSVIEESVKHVRMVDEPVLIIQGTHDPLAGRESAEYIYNNIRSKKKKLLFLDVTSHRFIIGDKKMTLLLKEIPDFMKMIDGNKESSE